MDRTDIGSRRRIIQSTNAGTVFLLNAIELGDIGLRNQTIIRLFRSLARQDRTLAELGAMILCRPFCDSELAGGVFDGDAIRIT